MRIISLLPYATEIVCALGLADSLVGRSHACDFPANVMHVPVMSFSQQSTALHNKDAALLAAKPDLIIGHALPQASGAQLLSLQPACIEEIFDAINSIAEATHTQTRAKELIDSLRRRISMVQSALSGAAHHPTVAALEWLDPPYAAGNWLPEMIELAGGQSVFGATGEPSHHIEWDDVIQQQPECVLCAPCGLDVKGAVEQFTRVAQHEAWRDIPAAYLNQVICTDANAYFSRPGPRVVDGIEILAGLLHPDKYPQPDGARALRVQPFALDQFS